MYLFYCFSLIPLFVGFILWLKCKSINLLEWVIGTACAFLVSGIIHLVAAHGMTADTETWSGEINKITNYPEWLEYYEEAIYRTEYYYVTETYYTTDSKGRRRSHTRRVRHSRQVFDHWEPRQKLHHEYWTCESTLNQHFSITKNDYDRITKKFGKIQSIKGKRITSEHNSRMISGDPNDYIGVNINKWIEPVTDVKPFENKIKAAPSVFSFIDVPTNVFVYKYPKNENKFQSDRLIGDARQKINLLKFDQLNSYLGPRKLINLILIGFVDKDSMIGEYQKAKWVGGKKNDLVLMYNIDSTTKKVSWARVFGWSESEICKRSLETLLITEPIDDTILDKIKMEIIGGNYKIKDWNKFDYLTIEPRTIHFIWYFVIMILTQVGLYVYFAMNEYDKLESN